MNIKHDLAKLQRDLDKIGRGGVLPRAASQAINRATKSVNATAVREVAQETGTKQKEIRQAHKLYLANRARLQAAVDASRARARNLIEWVRPSQARPNYFNERLSRGKYRAKGVKSKAWGKLKTYRGSFIQQASNGKMLVLRRTGKKGKRGGTTEALVGPSPRRTFLTERVENIMRRQAAARIRIELQRSIENELRKVKR